MKSVLALALAAPALAAYRGFNYGANDLSGVLRDQASFESEFRAAKSLAGTNGAFTSARLYTSLQGSTGGPISAIPAAIATDTSLLLGIWASEGAETVQNEINAILAAVTQYGDAFTSRVAGISVGSEDVYRTTDLGIASNAGRGATPQEIADYVNQVRAALSDTTLASKPIGHVDTYNTYSNSSGWMAPVIDAVNFIGMDAYPYFESNKANSIDTANATFYSDYEAVLAVSRGKDVWITETGWPTSGPQSNEAIPSVENAERYYAEVGCKLFGDGVNTWWYTLQDSTSDASVPSFGVTGEGVPPPTNPKYDLTC